MLFSQFLLISLVHFSLSLDCALHEADADVIIGVSMCFRSPGARGKCGVEGYSHISECYESMLWSINLLNQNNGTVFDVPVSDSFIPGIRIGLKTLDDCGLLRNALKNVQRMTSQACKSNSNPYLLGMIGSCGVRQTCSIASKLNTFKLPLLSPLFGTLSQSENNLSKFPNLYQVFPSDGLNELYQVIISLIEEFKWSKISILYEDNIDWKINLVKDFVKTASIKFCVGNLIKVPQNGKKQTYQKIIQKLLSSKKSSGIIYLSGSNTTLSKLLNSAKVYSEISYLKWIIYDTDNMEFVVENFINFTRGAFLVQHNSIRPKLLSKYIYAKTPLTHYPNDPWFPYYFMKTKQCYLPNYNFSPYNDNPPCSSVTYDKEFLLTFAFHPYCINSIYIFANALKNAWSDKCNGKRGMCSKLENLSPNEFNERYVKPIQFVYDSTNRGPPELLNMTIKFDSNNRLTWRNFKYGIRNLQVIPGFKYPKVFSYEGDKLKHLAVYKFYDRDGNSLGDNISASSTCDSVNCQSDVCLNFSNLNL